MNFKCVLSNSLYNIPTTYLKFKTAFKIVKIYSKCVAKSFLKVFNLKFTVLGIGLIV